MPIKKYWMSGLELHSANLTSVKNILDCINKNRKKDMGLNTNFVDY